MTRTILTAMTIAAAAYAIFVATPAHAGFVWVPNGISVNGINPNGGMFNGALFNGALFNGTATVGSAAGQLQLQGLTLRDGRSVGW